MDPTQKDQAWITISTPFSPKKLLDFCSDIERFLRINPLIEITQYQPISTDRFQLVGKNLSNEQAIDCEVYREQAEHGFRLVYSEGLKSQTLISIHAENEGSVLKIVDDYGCIPEQEREARLNEVDKSLVPWGHALHKFIKNWNRWSWLPLWRWYMQRLWLPMTPSSRRVANMVVVVTALEFFAFLMVFTIFWLELDKLLPL